MIMVVEESDLPVWQKFSCFDKFDLLVHIGLGLWLVLVNE